MFSLKQLSNTAAILFASAFMLITSVVIGFYGQPAHAESEASSEAGLEAPTLARRRNRRINRQHMMQERAHERQVRVHQEKTDRTLQNRSDKDFVHNYGSKRRRRGLLQPSQQQQQQSQAKQGQPQSTK